MFLWNIAVTSLAEVWIEIVHCRHLQNKRSASLPLRKCGLKSIPELIPMNSWKSLPLRKCGLKFYKKYSVHVHNASLPLRKCGLKSICPFIHTAQPIVTSLAEVWIEIPTAPPSSSGSWSLPLRKCGLKSYTCGCIT